jgi:hypothetical protein
VLAPVLARLEGLEGVAGASVESSGRFFALELCADADTELTRSRVLRALGPGARLLSREATAAQLEGKAVGEPWFSSREIRGLSLVEGRILVARATSAASKTAALDEPARCALEEALRHELFALIGRVHDQGGRASTRWLAPEWPAMAERALERARVAVPASALAALARALAEPPAG